MNRANDLVHSKHLKGFSPVWILMCLMKSIGFLNDLAHLGHLCSYVVSLLWALMCRFKLIFTAKDWEHTWQIWSSDWLTFSDFALKLVNLKYILLYHAATNIFNCTYSLLIFSPQKCTKTKMNMNTLNLIRKALEALGGEELTEKTESSSFD